MDLGEQPDRAAVPAPAALAAERAAAAARAARRTALIMTLVVILHSVHCFNDGWFGSSTGSILHILVSTVLVAAAVSVSRQFGLLVLFGQPALFAAALGVASSYRNPIDSPSQHVVYRIGMDDEDGCYLEPSTRLLTCPPVSRFITCVPPLFDYRIVNMATATYSERALYGLLGPVGTSYFGLLPSSTQLYTVLLRNGVSLRDAVPVPPSVQALGITQDDFADLQGQLIDFAAPGASADLVVAPFGTDLVVIADADLTTAQLRVRGAHANPVPGYQRVILADPSFHGDQRQHQ